MLNINAVNALADLLDNLPAETETGFNMMYYNRALDHSYMQVDTHVEHECGTVCCIAGWAAMYLQEGDQPLRETPAKRELHHLPRRKAREILGLTEHQTRQLFEPMDHDDPAPDLDWYSVTPKQAAKVLRHLAATSVVDWTIIH
ncbi:hypothetical protein JYP52_01245 [Nitratireductor aquibiodomus]|uniref:hypothetical protein n=1 Tax=Nitratireductor aquibiodomus TaxID=204799 RepID=UPI0019D3E84F|nr:hypothetical protein [Nitratireductor aquibiodomus]MBN7759747.1 hypothetical protein [Nitratireductor aquibiodomus]